MPKVFTASHRNKHPAVSLALLLVSALLMLLESRMAVFHAVRAQAVPFIQKTHAVVLAPYQMGHNAGQWLRTQESWIRQNQLWQLERQHLLAQKDTFEVLIAENSQLKELLNLRQNFPLDLISTQVVHASPALGTVIINKGSEDGIQEGAGVMGPYGAVGFVEKVFNKSAEVLLLNHPRHAIAIQSNRSGVRAIASGQGAGGSLSIDHIPDTTDIAEGDLLVTSGLGERFPFGVPVGLVLEVKYAAGEPFSNILAMPHQPIDRLDYVLVIKSGDADA